MKKLNETMDYAIDTSEVDDAVTDIAVDEKNKNLIFIVKSE